ncbi:PqqD family protein [Desulfolutivibrio sp.]|uniref:PqqD family protein n=1 Tax=Desulfolutivibrio sp. TaxID=2773296 RepID=UPI002F96719E
MGFFRKKKAAGGGGLSRGEALSFVPVKNAAVRQETTGGGKIRLTYPVTVRPAFSGMLRRFGVWDGRPSDKTIELDELGAATWDLADGVRSVRQVSEVFAGRYGLGAREAEIAVASFFRELGRRGLVGFQAPGDGDA